MQAFIKQRGTTQVKETTEEKTKQIVKRDKTTEVLKHLKSRGHITSMDAFNLYGATRLSAIIFNLRKKGYNIVTVDEKCKDRYGHTCNYAKYVLEED